MFTQHYDDDGNCDGVVTTAVVDGFPVGTYQSKAPGNRLWEAFLTWNAEQNPPLDINTPGMNNNTPALITARLRQLAIAQLTSPSSTCKVQRATVLGILDSAVSALNTLRQWDVSLKAAVAASTSLADLKTRVAALPSLGDLVEANVVNAVKSAIQTHINNGDAD